MDKKANAENNTFCANSYLINDKKYPSPSSTDYLHSQQNLLYDIYNDFTIKQSFTYTKDIYLLNKERNAKIEKFLNKTNRKGACVKKNRKLFENEQKISYIQGLSSTIDYNALTFYDKSHYKRTAEKNYYEMQNRNEEIKREYSSNIVTARKNNIVFKEIFSPNPKKIENRNNEHKVNNPRAVHFRNSERLARKNIEKVHKKTNKKRDIHLNEDESISE